MYNYLLNLKQQSKIKRKTTMVEAEKMAKKDINIITGVFLFW